MAENASDRIVKHPSQDSNQQPPKHKSRGLPLYQPHQQCYIYIITFSITSNFLLVMENSSYINKTNILRVRHHTVMQSISSFFKNNILELHGRQTCNLNKTTGGTCEH